MEQLLKLDRFHVSAFARLPERMNGIEKANGTTLLDNTIFTLGTGMGDGTTHQYNNPPLVDTSTVSAAPRLPTSRSPSCRPWASNGKSTPTARKPWPKYWPEPFYPRLLKNFAPSDLACPQQAVINVNESRKGTALPRRGTNCSDSRNVRPSTSRVSAMTSSPASSLLKS